MAIWSFPERIPPVEKCAAYVQGVGPILIKGVLECWKEMKLDMQIVTPMSIQRLHLPIRRVWTVKPWVLSGCRCEGSMPLLITDLPSAFRDIAEKPAEALVFSLMNVTSYKRERLLVNLEEAIVDWTVVSHFIKTRQRMHLFRPSDERFRICVL
ncbi:hypothetical protein BKA70DRAFT_680513 [Coprinopsis sp. MPI-PUGE-AT-0042]|nr:hypothetical protein BKA70DRAFT_680513 [Coprinopsis sp. MPI-PUGE-AT-0042]